MPRSLWTTAFCAKCPKNIGASLRLYTDQTKKNGAARNCPQKSGAAIHFVYCTYHAHAHAPKYTHTRNCTCGNLLFPSSSFIKVCAAHIPAPPRGVPQALFSCTLLFPKASPVKITLTLSGETHLHCSADWRSCGKVGVSEAGHEDEQRW